MIQKIVLSIVLFCAVSIVAFFLLIKVIDFNEYKPKIQKAIKESTGYEIMIRGDITLSLSPVGVSISDIEVANPSYRSDVSFAKLGSFDVALDIAALLKKEIKIKYLVIDNLALSIEKNKEGKLNYLLPPVTKEVAHKSSSAKSKKVEEIEAEEDALFINVNKVKFTHASMTYTDLSDNAKMMFENIDVEMNDIHFDPSKHSLNGLVFLSQMHIDKISYDRYVFNDVSMSMEMKDAVGVSENLKYTLFDTLFQGSGKFDFSGKQPKISLKHKIEGLKLAPFIKGMFQQDIAEGTAEGDLKLSFTAGDALSFKTTLNGYVNLFGKNVTLKGYDLDQIAPLVDTHASKNLGTILNSSLNGVQGGKTTVQEISMRVDIGYSEIELSDVAFSTAKNRVALKGKINIVEEKFVDLKAALLNAKGCSVFEQKISGTFAKPKVKMDESNAKILTNVALSFFTKNDKSTADSNCTVFYEGVITQPVPLKEDTKLE